MNLEKNPPTKQNEIEIEWEKILSKFPEQLRQEIKEERPNPDQEDIECFSSLCLLDPEPVFISLQELLKTNEVNVLRCSPDVIEEINKKWETNFNVGSSKVYDQNPNRVRKYSQMSPDTAQPSVLVDREIMFGVGRFIAALLRKDSSLRVWNLSKKLEDK